MTRRKTFRVEHLSGSSDGIVDLTCRCGENSACYLKIHCLTNGPVFEESSIPEKDTLDLEFSTPESLRAQAALLKYAAKVVEEKYPHLVSD